MIAHLVAFRFQDDVAPDHVETVWSALQGLVATVPSLHAIYGGRDLGFNDANYDMAFVAFFDDEAGWRAYQSHPAHVEVGSTLVAPYLAARAAAQFPWTGPLPG